MPMKCLKTLLASSVAIFGASSTAEHPKLSEAGRNAFLDLCSSQIFSDVVVGFEGRTSKQVQAFRTLLRQPGADAAFKQLIIRGTPAGQLYGLCGIYFTDQKHFLSTAERFRSVSTQVYCESGCVTAAMSVGSIVASRHPDALRLDGPRDTPEDWLRRNKKQAYHADIIGGAYPIAFAGEARRE